MTPPDVPRDGDADRFGVAFPGQGNKRPAMVRALHTHRAHPLVDAFLRAHGEDPEALDLNDTTVAQPATYALGVAAAQAAFGPEPAVPLVVGHSLGELTAVACSGMIDVWDGYRLAVRRGEVSRDHGLPGAMLAVMGARGTAIEWLRRTVVARTGGVLEVAGYNGVRQTVLSGDPRAVEAALEVAGETELLAEILPIGGSFHSPLMAGALPAWRAEVASVPFRRGRSRYVSTADAAEHHDPEEIRELLVRALLLPVRWTDAVRAVRDAGFHTLYDAGPGTTLAKLGRREGVLRFASLPEAGTDGEDPGEPAPRPAPDTALEALT
ncbi:ACP S-malonyltransferase [Streptomyces sp. 4N509B]|uniref:ACP S-malonyltransferase n=1 Tax=Streptomyces sp. 4N509B TaxID=3457413 RepID=UPI003FD4DF80